MCVGDAQDAQDDAVRALASGRNFFFCDGLYPLVGFLFPTDLWDVYFEIGYYITIAVSSLGPDVLHELGVPGDVSRESH